MGAIIGALIGRHLQHEQERRDTARDMIIPALKKHVDDPAGSNLTPDDADKLLTHAIKMKLVPKDYAYILQDDLKAARAKYDAVQAAKQYAQDTAPKTQGMGMPTMNPSAAAAPAPSEPLGFSPVGGPPPQQQLPAPPGPLDQSAMAQRLLGLVLAQKQPQQAGATPPGPGPGQAPGMPTPPFSGEAGAGPAPPNPRPEMSKAATAGGVGFNVLPPAPAPAAPAPVDPWVEAQNGPPRLFPIHGVSLAVRNARAGTAKAAENLPLQEQTNRLALEHAGAISRQATELQIAEAQRRIQVLKASPGWDKIPANLQIEAIKQALGIPGGLSNVMRPLNLPKSQIHGPDIPEGATGIDGRPIDRSAGKFYEQQQDVATGDIRYYRTTPRITTIERLTTAGPVLVSTDQAGNIVKATYKIDGREIVDPRLLETIRSGLVPVPVITKDENGDPVTTWVVKEANTTSQKVIPGQGAGGNRTLLAPPGGAAPAAGAAPGGAAPAGAASAAAPAPRSAPRARGVNLPPTLPKADPASVFKTVQYARSIQKRFPDIDSAIADLKSTGDFGTIMSRWNEFMAGTLGAGDPRYAALRADMDMFDSALGVVHQTRGVEQAKHFKDLANAGKMDAPTFEAAYGVLKKWVNDYATMGANAKGAVKPGGGAPASSSNLPSPPAGTPGAGKTYVFKGSQGNMMKLSVSAKDEKEFLAAHPDAKPETK